MTENKSRGTAFVIVSGMLWGCTGLFVRRMSSLGFSSLEISSLRFCLSAVIFIALLLIKEPGGFRIAPRDIPLFLALGLLSVLFFTLCYFTAIVLLPMSIAAILLYTSPIWVALLSVIFFHEKMSGRRLLCLGLAFFGCVLVSGLGGGSISLKGLLLGLGAGLGYGLYSIFGSVAVKKYSTLTVTTYAILIAAVGSCFVCGGVPLFAAAKTNPGNIPFFVFMALFSNVAPYLCYTVGLRYTSASKAAILATVEPLMATLLGTLILREPIGLPAILGIALILAAIVLLNRGREG